MSPLGAFEISSDFTYPWVPSHLLDPFCGHFSIILCFLFLAYASWLDVRTGSAPNELWFTACISGCVLSFCKSMIYDPTRVFVTTALSLAVAFFLSLVLFRMKLFGGADAKALTTLSIFTPTVIPLFPSLTFPLLTSLSTTVNLVVFLTLVFSVNFACNFFGYIFGEKVLRISGIPRVRKFSLLYAYKRLPLRIQNSRVVFHLFSGRSSTPFSLVIIEDVRRSRRRVPNGESDSIRHGCSVAEGWIPLRIPVIPLLTLSLFVSLLVGDLLLLFVK